jgi:hypothetical protein
MILLKLRGSIDVESVKGMEHVSAVLPLAGGRVAFVQKVRLSAPSEIQDKLVAIAWSAHKLPGSTRTHALAATGGCGDAKRRRFIQIIDSILGSPKMPRSLELLDVGRTHYFPTDWTTIARRDIRAFS